MAAGMLTRRGVLGLAVLSSFAAACEAIGLHGKVVTSFTKNGHTTVHERKFKNWDEFEDAMGEVGTDFSEFAKEVGAVTAKLIRKLTDVPPPGKVRLGQLDPSLQQFEGNIKYDYIKVATMQPNTAYDFTYVQIGMKEYDDFFRASAEMYGTAYQLLETGRHILLAKSAVAGEDPPSSIQNGTKKLPKLTVENALDELSSVEKPEIVEQAKQLASLYKSVVTLGADLVAKAEETVSTGVALVESAPKQILNPQLVLHLKLIVKGLAQSLDLVKDTGGLLLKIV